MTEPTPALPDDPLDPTAAEAKARELSERWAARLDSFHLPCPLCRGQLVFQGVTPERLYEFAEGEHGVVEPLMVYPLVFICDECGYTASFDSDLFNPAYLARLSGAGAREVAALDVTNFRVLVVLRGDEHSDTLLDLATAFVGGRGGEVIVFNAARTDALAEQVEARLHHFRPAVGDPAPVRVLRRGSRPLQEALPKIVSHEQCDWVLLDARGWAHADEAAVAAAIDAVVALPDTDAAIVYDRGLPRVTRILFVTSGGPSARAAAPFALQLARAFDAALHLLYVASPDDPDAEATGHAHIADTLAGLELVESDQIQRRVVIGRNPVQIIVNEAPSYDLLISGGSPRGRRGPKRLDSLSDKIARNAPTTAINVLAKEERQRSWLSRLLG
jgi:nucleotide-binding universal stress UspA family protein